MVPEVVMGYFVKLLATGVVGALSWLTWLTRSNTKRLQDIYTKKEVDNQIDLKLEPIEREFNVKLSTLLSATEVASKQREQTNAVLTRISEDIAVVKTEINHLKDT